MSVTQAILPDHSECSGPQPADIRIRIEYVFSWDTHLDTYGGNEMPQDLRHPDTLVDIRMAEDSHRHLWTSGYLRRNQKPGPGDIWLFRHLFRCFSEHPDIS